MGGNTVFQKQCQVATSCAIFTNFSQCSFISNHNISITKLFVPVGFALLLRSGFNFSTMYSFLVYSHVDPFSFFPGLHVSFLLLFSLFLYNMRSSFT